MRRTHLICTVTLLIAACSPSPGPQGPVGPRGEGGLKGDKGEPGVPGESVVGVSLVAGDAICPYGGAKFTTATGETFACNGAPGGLAPHQHAGADITSKVAQAAVADSVPWSGVTGAPAEFPPSSHAHNANFSCPDGEQMTGVNASGMPTCSQQRRRRADLIPRPNETKVIAQGTRAVGMLSAFGNPIIAASGKVGLVVLRCVDETCSSFSQKTIDPTATEYLAMTLGSDGFPLIAYQATSGLKVTKCQDELCEAFQLNTPLPGNSGQHLSIGLARDGAPVIAHHSSTNNGVLLLKCANAACTGIASNFIVESGGQAPTLLLDALTGFPTIGLRSTAGALKLVWCTTSDCSGTPNTYEGATILPEPPAMRQEGSNLYIDCAAPSGTYLFVNTVCSNYTCSAPAADASRVGSASTGILPSGWFQSAHNPASGLVVRIFNQRLNMVQWATDLDPTGGLNTSAFADGFGMPMVAHSDGANIRLTRCANQFCTPYWTERGSAK